MCSAMAATLLETLRLHDRHTVGPMEPTMSLDLPGEDDPRRQEIRAWLTEHPEPTPTQLRDRGLIVPHWPEPGCPSPNP